MEEWLIYVLMGFNILMIDLFWRVQRKLKNIQNMLEGKGIDYTSPKKKRQWEFGFQTLFMPDMSIYEKILDRVTDPKRFHIWQTTYPVDSKTGQPLDHTTSKK